jgi:hypothetical protein
MNKALEIQELAIAIAAKNLNPGVFNPDFLKYTGIVPKDWELAKPPVYSNGVAQILFSNGLAIFAQPNQIALVESIGNKQLEEVTVAKIASHLVEKVSEVEYQAVGINPRGFVSFDSPTGAEQYICNQLLSPGSWQEFSQGKMNAALQLTYPLDRGQLNLSINQATIQFPNQKIPAILFSGNFNYPLSGESPIERSQDLQQLLQRWEESFTTFHNLLLEKFLPLADRPTSVTVLSPILAS